MSITWDNGFHERDAAYYAAVGYLCHQWNAVESLFYGLPCDIMGVGRQFHTLLFRHLGIKTVQSFLEDYAAFHITDPDTVAQIKYVNAYIERCRINRNIIVHALATVDPQTAEPIYRTLEDKNRATPKTFVRSVTVVRRCCDECEVAGKLIIGLSFFFLPPELASQMEEGFDRRNATPGAWRARLRARPPLPESLEQVPSPTPPKPRASRKSPKA